MDAFLSDLSGTTEFEKQTKMSHSKTLVVDEDVVFIIDLKLKINRKLYGWE